MEHDSTYDAKTGDKNTLSPDLAALLAGGRLGHAYIFTGQQGLTQALVLAQAVNCTAPREGQPCGMCPSCKKVTESCHPDIRVLRPEKDAHRIEAMRRLQVEAYLHSYEGGKKFFILESAELLLPEAANNLLKVLEEPPVDTIFILACATWDKLLPTIRSRCQLFTFGSGHSVVLDEARLEALLPQAAEFLERLPNLTLTQAMQEDRREEKDKVGWLHYLAALMRVLAQAAKGERLLSLGPKKSLTAALMLEHTSDLLRRNINQKLLLDIIFLRLWQYMQEK